MPLPAPPDPDLDLEEMLERDLARWEEQELGADDPRLPPGWNPAWDTLIDPMQDPVQEISEDDYDWDNYDASLAT